MILRMATTLSSFVLLLSLFHVTAFTIGPSKTQRRTTEIAPLFELIESASEDDYVDVDDGVGGVRLAKESAICITGIAEEKLDFVSQEMKRYTKVTSLDESGATSELHKAGGVLICSGTGVEVYKDPGDTTISSIVLAPLDAVTKALASKSEDGLENAKKVVINFIGGNDLMMHEVLNGAKQTALGLGLDKSNAKIIFQSLCHESFPLEKSSVTVLAFKEVNENGRMGTDIYFHEGSWWTVKEENINNAID